MRYHNYDTKKKKRVKFVSISIRNSVNKTCKL